MELVICWLYFDLMNTYGDRGNLETLIYRLKERQIKFRVKEFTIGSSESDLLKTDLFLMGGAEDAQQQLVEKDLTESKRQALLNKLQSGTPGLFICGAYQLLGEYYEIHNQERLKGLGLAPFYTTSPSPSEKRLIGEMVVKVTHPTLLESELFTTSESRFLIGFENHGGRTYLSDPKLQLGTVIRGQGNNGTDGSEGLLATNTIGTYSHGPLLPRNPQLADFLIEKALSIKYNQLVKLKTLPDETEQQNRRYLLKTLNVQI
jgi:CobQ-like glutamine amidotransferase family enzyme